MSIVQLSECVWVESDHIIGVDYRWPRHYVLLAYGRDGTFRDRIHEIETPIGKGQYHSLYSDGNALKAAILAAQTPRDRTEGG